MDRNTIDARGARIALTMYLRWIWVPVVALAAGFFVGGFFSTFEGPSSNSTANITVGLTEEVRWPFFDAVLARQQGLIQEGDLANAATSETGIEHVSVVVESSNVQNSTLQIAAVVQGGSGEAETYANALGDLLIEANLADQRDGLLLNASNLTREITDLEVEISNLGVDLDRAETQWVEVQEELVVAEPEDAPQLRLETSDLDNERRLIQRQIDAQLGLATNLRTQLAQAEREVDQTGTPIEVSASAIAEGSSATDLRPIFAVLFFLLSLIAIPFLEQIFGKVRTLDHLGSLWPEARLVDARNRRLENAPINPIDVARLAVVADSTPGDSVAVAGLASSKITDFLAQSLADQGTQTSIVELASTQGMEQVVASDQLALVVPAGRVPLRRANRSVANLETLSADPIVVVLASKDKGNGVLHTSYGELTEPSELPEDPSSILTTEILPADDHHSVLDEEIPDEEEESSSKKASRWGPKKNSSAEVEDIASEEIYDHELISEEESFDDQSFETESQTSTKTAKKSKNARSKKNKGRAA